MGIWDQLSQLSGGYVESLREIYAKRNFPYEVRGQFAAWFEEQDWDFDENLPENANRASELLSVLLHKLDSFCKEHSEDLMSQMRYLSLQNKFLEAFETNPQLFVAVVREIINDEKLILFNILNPSSQVMEHNLDEETRLEADVKTTIAASLKQLHEKVVVVDTFIKDCRDKQEQYVIELQNQLKHSQKIEQEIQRRLSASNATTGDGGQIEQIRKRKQEMEKKVKSKAISCIRKRQAAFNELCITQNLIHNITNQVILQLYIWNSKLQKSLSGAQAPEPLGEIQGWFESLSSIVWNLFSVASQYKILCDTWPHTQNSGNISTEQNEQLLKNIGNNISSLILRSFVIDKHPPQVLKTQTKFQSSVRLLVGSKFNLQMNCGEVRVSILSESQCSELKRGKSLEEVGTCGQILNNKGVLEFNSDQSALIAEFKNLQLKDIKRKDRKGQESVLEAKNALVFSAKLNVGGSVISPIVMSLPVVVVVHGNQIPNSEATIFWDNMFSNPSREAFDVPDSVDCEELLSALNARWTLSNERKLTHDNLLFLKEKLSRLADNGQYSQRITWGMFNKNPLIQGKPFTFWEWFFQANEVIRKCLKSYWTNHSLELFTSKKTTERKLLDSNVGTFLIRCSESDIGYVSIACCVESNDKKGIWHFKPWSVKDFQIRNLADRIFDLPNLTHLYPNIPKEDKFSDLRCKEDASHDFGERGYVDTGIMACIKPSHLELQLESPHTPCSTAIQTGFDTPYSSISNIDSVTGYDPNSPLFDPFDQSDSLYLVDESLDSFNLFETMNGDIDHDDFQNILNDLTQNANDLQV